MNKKDLFYIPKNWERELERSRNSSISQKLQIKRGPHAKLIGNTTLIGDDIYIEKYKNHSGTRFVWKRLNLSDDLNLYVLRDALNHDEYDDKYNCCRDTAEWKSLIKFSAEEDAELAQYSEELTAQKVEERDELQPLSDAESLFLDMPSDINSGLFQDVVYESRYWIDFVKALDKESFSRYAQCLLKVVIENESQNVGDSDWVIEKTGSRTNDNLVLYHQIRNKDGIVYNDWILAGVINDEDTATPGAIFEDLQKNINENMDVRIGARRAYPFTMLEDPDYWQDMERDFSSNMRLSSEESDVIGQSDTFPLFISGRAGSGKSTVLQYMFAEILLRYLKTRKDADDRDTLMPPLYLSYSDNLIESARRLTKSLFSHSHLYQDKIKEANISYQADIKPLIDDTCFVTFGKLISKMIAENNERDLERFPDDKHITFSSFRKMWEKKFGKVQNFKGYGPSLCWHIIKTYIKGWKSDACLSPEDYNEIGRNNMSVSKPVYKFVYDNVWKNWYSQLRNEKYWDDQDLVRFCLHPSDSDPTQTCVSPSYSAVFCDESQDFTRIELEVILGLSSLVERRHETCDAISKIPFVFAGDEFQTLSPTGFSWDSLRSFFTKQLAARINRNDSELPQKEPVQLVNNYRSSRSIVKLGNRLQLLRFSRFGQMSQPQQTYFTEQGELVYYFPNSDEVWPLLKNKNIFLIVPSDEGQSAKDYIENSPLQGKISFYDDGSPEGITVLNPAQAQGLEYDNVAIFGFGDCNSLLRPDSIFSWLYGQNDSKDAVDLEIDAKYHLNNAYVAITRAKKRLFVIDDDIKDSLWGVAVDSQLKSQIEKKMLERVSIHRYNEWTADALGTLLQGNIQQDLNVGDTGNPMDWENGIKELYNLAISRQDASMMRQVAARYKEGVKNDEYHSALGEAYVIEQDFDKAVSEFQKANKCVKAVEYCWLGINADNIEAKLGLLDQYFISGKGDISKTHLAHRINNAVSLSEYKDLLCDLSMNFEQTKSLSEKNIYRILAQHLLNFLPAPNKDETDALDLIAGYIEPFQSSKDFVVSKYVDILEKNEKYNLLIQVCERQQFTCKAYYRSKLKVTSFPKRILFYELAYPGEWREKIFQDFSKNQIADIRAESTDIITRIAESVISCSNDIRQRREYLALYLSLEKDPAKAKVVIADLLPESVTRFNRNELDLIMAVKFDNAAALSEIVGSQTSASGNARREIYNVASRINEVMSPEFSFNTSSLNSSASKYFDKEFKSYVRTVLATPFLLALGKKMDLAGQYIDSIRFYEWAARNAHEADRSLFNLLRLKNVEGKAKVDKGIEMPDMPERRKLGVQGPLETDLEEAIQVSRQKAWERIISSALIHGSNETVNFTVTRADEKSVGTDESSTADKTSANIEKENPVPSVSDKPDSTAENPIANAMMEDRMQTSVLASTGVEAASAVPLPATMAVHAADTQSLPKIEFMLLSDFRIIYDCNRKRLVVRDINSELQLSVYKGKISGDSDFEAAENGQLVLEGKLLPVRLLVKHATALLEHLTAEGQPTGVVHMFPV